MLDKNIKWQLLNCEIAHTFTAMDRKRNDDKVLHLLGGIARMTTSQRTRPYFLDFSHGKVPKCQRKLCQKEKK